MHSLQIFFVILAFAYWNFPVYVTFVPDVINQVIYNGIPILYIIYNQKNLRCHFNKCVHSKWFLGICFVSFFTIIWAMISLALNDSKDYSYFMKLFIVFRRIYVSIFLFFLATSVMPKKDSFVAFCYCWGWSIVFCVTFTCVVLLIPDFRMWYQPLVAYNQKADSFTDIAMYITRFSIGGYAGFGQSIICSCSFLFSLYLIYKQYKVGILFLLFSLLGNMFYGRFGIILSLFIFLFMFIRTLSFKRFFREIVITGTIIITFYVSLEFINNPVLDAWKLWLLEPVEAFFTSLELGQISFGSSGDKLAYGMYFMPSFDTLIFGDGRYLNVDGSYYMHTDAGYMRGMLYFGVIGLLFLYGIYFLLCLWGIHRSSEIYKKYMCEVILLLLFLEEYKGDAYELFFGVIVAIVLSCYVKYDYGI